jgi:formylmethanofuran dehydrogenase subunit D
MVIVVAKVNVVNLTNVLPSVVQNVIHIPRALLQSTVVNTDTSTTTMFAGEVV